MCLVALLQEDSIRIKGTADALEECVPIDAAAEAGNSQDLEQLPLLLMHVHRWAVAGCRPACFGGGPSWCDSASGQGCML